MCRLLYVRAETPFQISAHLQSFAGVAKNSKEYQGHGWGCAYLSHETWRLYKSIKPVWEDDLKQFGQTTLLVAHARSAFQNRDIHIRNNMPFKKDRFVFVFNGELRGVRIKETGRIGAEKLFNFIYRFYDRDMLATLQKATAIIQKRTTYIRAMNILIADHQRVYVASHFNEDADYFTLHHTTSEQFIICSEPYSAKSTWQALPNHTLMEY